MEQTTKKIKDTVADVRESIDQVRQEAMDTTARAYAKGEQVWDELRVRGEKVVNSAQQKGKEILDEVTEESLEGLTMVRRYVRKNPGKAVGIAVLSGIVLGALLFSGSSKDE